MDVLFISGVADNHQIKAVLNEKGQFQYLLSGSCSVGPKFEKNTAFQTYRFILAGSGGRQTYAFKFKPDVIFNEISDADSHGRALARCVDFCKQQGANVINAPESIQRTRRDQVSEKLQGIEGVTVPQTLRFYPNTLDQVRQKIEAHFSGPVLLREAGLHGGNRLVKIDDLSVLEQKLYAFALDGRPYYLTAFQDFADSDGLYRKYRFAVVEGVPYLRHKLVNNSWKVHRTARQFMAKLPNLVEEEKKELTEFYLEPSSKLSKITATIAERLNLDYFGIDCHLDREGNMLIFEANANMNILINTERSPNIWEAPIQAICEHIQGMIVKSGAQK
ncbi:hypothetical protein CI610_00386 [invertebrate metagenome]|uniref:ATP-grasp domain-containing protein n=1 Tax=invertebrate metagenome TaxID=1711999 RepID=A0A2H9TBS1_9ZZZZ